MKQVISTLFLCVAVMFTFAQQAQSVFRFEKAADVSNLLQVLQTELKLNADQTNRLKELFTQSLQSQERSAQSNVDMATAVKRQEAHLEGNMQQVLGEELFNQYKALKAALPAKLHPVPASGK